MIKSHSIYLFLCVFLPVVVSAQSDSAVWINGKIIDSGSGKPVPYANIASYSQHLMYAADSTGSFYIQLPYMDSVKVVVLGYHSRVFRIDSVSNLNEDISLFPLSRSSIMLSNVDVNLRRGFFSSDKELERKGKGFEDYDLHLPRDIVMYDKSKDIIPASYKPVFRHRPPVVAFLIHPISYINYFTSKRERSKRRISKIIYSQKKKVQLSNDIIKEISGFKDDELERFIIYCNKNIKIKTNDTESTLKQKVFLALEEYLSSKKTYQD
jgi:hypothetical protein